MAVPLTRDELHAAINAAMPDQYAQAVSVADVRLRLHELADSSANLAEDEAGIGPPGPPGPPGPDSVVATGATASRHLQDRFADSPNVEDWRGYGGDSSDTGTIQAALSRATTRLDFPERLYAVESTLLIPSNLHVHANRARFDCSTAADSFTMFHAQGSVGSDYPLTATPALYGSSLSISAPNLLSSGIVADDWIEVVSEDVFDPDRTVTRIGEIQRVLTASGTSITLQGTLASPIPYATAPKVRRITGIIDFQWHGGVLLGRTTGTAPAQTGLKISYGINCHVYDLRSYRIMAHGLWFSHCISSWAHDCSFFDSRNPGTGYGVLAGYACRDCGAENLAAVRCRHAFTTGGSPSSDYGISTSCGVRGGYSMFSLGDSFDTHACSMDTFFEGCTAYDSSAQGFNVECPTARVNNCATYRSIDNGASFHNDATACAARYVVNGFHSEGSGDHGLQFARAAVTTHDPGVDLIQATGITVLRPGDLGLYILWDATCPSKAKNVKVSGTIEGGGNNAANIEYATDVDLSGLTLKTTDPTRHGLQLNNCDRVIAPVHVEMAAASTGRGLSLLASTLCDISNATGTSPGGVSSTPWLLDNNCVSCFWGDTPTAFTAARWPGFAVVPSIGTGASHRGNLYGTKAAHDEPSVAAGGSGVPFNVTVIGATVGDLVLAVSSSVASALTWAGVVTAADTVAVNSRNPTAGAIDPAAGAVIRVLVRKVT